ncbi:tRNA uridine 5-oxyacetic acid(34) methyltransferase CmoM [Pantoea eucrina]|uniref:tRNA uridine 5-oxyacetic acid(34) methyltransferase CmoM n=1 Tax=Pantoea eucrina TaxID=472693 RepID=UPI0024B6EF9B|nr:tRNA uridine 5-oxyacetic acid(34) methyltransferase CmoM [Pantoea eucrina]MDJ0025074.1 tRNA uridine 5-oxyacetic acid(34) methyltransferase CmoM [Pantoea eucrina]
MQDRNFDDLADKFSQNIYGTRKGLVRQAILWDELEALLPSLPAGPLSVLDAGGGVGQISSGLAARGHQVTLCDLSGEMLKLAADHARETGVSHNMQFRQVSAQQVGEHLDTPVDLVLFHAVLEWVADPLAVLQALWQTLKPGGVLSLMFYNAHGLTFRTLTLGNFGYLRANMTKRKKRTLSPDFPRKPQDVYQWLTQCGFVIEQRTGVRVFSDYMKPQPGAGKSVEEIIEMERRYCRQEPFLSLGRYIHVTARKPR